MNDHLDALFAHAIAALRRLTFMIAAAVMLFLLAFPALAADTVAGAPAVDPLLVKLSLHAGGIAVAIRGVVALLRSPLGGLLWLRVPPPARVLALVLLGALAVALENVAGGMPLFESIFVALGGVGGAITSHEVQSRVVKPRAKK